MTSAHHLGQNTYKDIVTHPSSEWSIPENLTIIMDAGNHNLRDHRTNIKAIVTPYFPSVIKAIGRRAQDQFESPVRLDSLIVLLTLRNTGWPCGQYLLVHIPSSFDPTGRQGQMIPLDNPDCIPRDISHLEGNIETLLRSRSMELIARPLSNVVSAPDAVRHCVACQSITTED